MERLLLITHGGTYSCIKSDVACAMVRFGTRRNRDRGIEVGK
jgi:hypothetical protein